MIEQSRQPKGTVVGGQFAVSLNPESSLILNESDPLGQAKVDVPRSESFGIIKSLEKARDEAEAEYEAAQRKVEDNGDIEDIENAAYSDGLRAGYDLALLKLREADMYVAADGNFGSAEELLLLDKNDVSKIDDIGELYDEWGDDLIVAVRHHLNYEPEFTLQYTDWHDVAQAVGDVIEVWNRTRDYAPEMDEAVAQLHFSYDTPREVAVERIIAVRDVWSSTKWHNQEMVEVDQRTQALERFLRKREES